MTKKIIITGSFGHIGSKLVEYLSNSQLKYKIILIDNFETERYSSIFNIKKNKNIKFYNLNLFNEEFNDEMKNAQILIHLAAKTNAEKSVNKKHNYIKNNYQITKKIINFCIKNKTKLIYISSTSVYGYSSNLVDENFPISQLNPQSPYAESKIKEERLLFRNKKKCNFVIYRFGTIFGFSSGMRFHTAVNKFCFQSSINEPITVWKTALHQLRPYLCLKDAINLINFTINKNLFNNEIYNAVTINTSVEKIINIIKKNQKKVNVEYVNSKIMNQLSYNVDNSKILREGFIFKGSLKRSIKETLNKLNKFNYL